MEHRFAAVAAAVLVAGLAGCASQPPVLGGPTAQVTINGKDTGVTDAVNCSQVGWTWIIEDPDEKSGFRAVVETGAELSAESVEIRDLGGFTGTYWDGNLGSAEASIENGTFTISGNVEGSFAENPTHRASATFEIKTNC